MHATQRHHARWGLGRHPAQLLSGGGGEGNIACQTTTAQSTQHGARTSTESRPEWVALPLTASNVTGAVLMIMLHRVTDLRPNDTEDAPFFYTFKVQCTSCREVHPNHVTVNRFEMNEQSGSKGEANFVWKCKNCKVVLSHAPPPTPGR